LMARRKNRCQGVRGGVKGSRVLGVMEEWSAGVMGLKNAALKLFCFYSVIPSQFCHLIESLEYQPNSFILSNSVTSAQLRHFDPTPSFRPQGEILKNKSSPAQWLFDMTTDFVRPGNTLYSFISPRADTTTSSTGISWPACFRASLIIMRIPPQHGTSMMAILMLLGFAF
jgi:hypothetical protein